MSDLMSLLGDHTIGVAMKVVAALLRLMKTGGKKTIDAAYKGAKFRITVERLEP